MSPETETFAELLRHTRTAKGLTQEVLAEQSGLSVRAISNLERGINRAPRKETLELLANALGLPPEVRRRWEGIRRRESVRQPSSVTSSPHMASPQLVALPSLLTTLIGREREIADVGKLLEEHRLVTVAGPGGIGKTRVAVAVGQESASRTIRSVVFVDLARVRDQALVLPAIAEALGVRPTVELSLSDALVLSLRGRCFLLILDNVEQVIQAAGDIATLLRACPSLKVLATSRATLHVSGEAEYLIRPLPLPERSQEIGIEQLRANPTVALFVERARLVKPGFDLTPENAGVIVAICQRLEGVPLAIELAAARLRSLSLQHVRERLEQALGLLTGGARDLPERQRSMRDTIQWSYDLLLPAEQALFRHVSVFVGGWMLDTAEAVLDPEGRSGVKIPDTLAALVEQGLAVQHEQADGTMRYRLLEPIREFAVEQLEQMGDADAVRNSHARAFVKLAKNAEPFLLSGSRQTWLDRLDSEHANLRFAISWLLGNDAVTALDLSGSLGWFWYLRGHFSEGRRVLTEALAADHSTIPSYARATALTSLARLEFYQESFENAVKNADAGLAMWRELGDQRGLAHALIVAGLTAIQPRRPGASDLLHGARRLFDGLGDRWGMAQALLYLGVAEVLGSPGDRLELDDAHRYLEQSAAIYRELDDSWQLGIVLSYLALTAERQGDTTTALHLHQESHALALASGDKWRIRLTGNRLGSLLHLTGDLASAVRIFTHALHVSRDLGVPEFLAYEHEQLGRVLVDARQEDDAIPLLEDALRTYRELGEQDDIAVILHSLGDACLLRGDARAAMSMYQDGLKAATAINCVSTVVNCLDGIAGLLAETGDAESAARLMSTVAAHRAGHELDAPHLYATRPTRNRDHLRSVLGDAQFERAWADGQIIHLDDAVASARLEQHDNFGVS